MKRILMASLIAVIAGVPGFAAAQGGSHGIPQGRQWSWVGVGVDNKSDSCAWITIYWSYKSEAHWRIAGGASRPRWVGPGQRWGARERFNHPLLGPQIRTRAQVMSTANGQCTGKTGRPDITTQINLSPKGPGIDCGAGAELTGNRSANNYRIFPNPLGPGFNCR